MRRSDPVESAHAKSERPGANRTPCVDPTAGGIRHGGTPEGVGGWVPPPRASVHHQAPPSPPSSWPTVTGSDGSDSSRTATLAGADSLSGISARRVRLYLSA